MINRFRSPAVIKKHRKRQYIRIGVAVSTFAVVLTGLAFFARAQSLQITTVTVNGEQAVPEESIKNIFNDQIAGTYAFLFPKSNSYLYPKGAIEKEINSTYRHIEDLAIESKDKHTIAITIKERTPFALWCDDQAQATNNNCYYLDNKGYVFSEAPHFSGTTFMKYYGLLKENIVGNTFLDQTKLAKINEFNKTLKEINFNVIGFEAENERNYVAHLNEGGKLLFNDQDGFEIVVENLKAALEQDGIKKDDIAKLDYINLRFDKKVFFKLKQ